MGVDAGLLHRHAKKYVRRRVYGPEGPVTGHLSELGIESNDYPSNPIFFNRAENLGSS